MYRTICKAFALLTLVFLRFIVLGQSSLIPTSVNQVIDNSVIRKQARISSFEENKGQLTGADADQVRYAYKNGQLSVFLLKTGIAYQFNKVHYPAGYKHHDRFETIEDQKHRELLAAKIKTETYRMDITLLDAKQDPIIVAEGKSSDYTNYYNRNALDVYSYSKVIYRDVYPNIDWVVYQHDDHIKYDFIVRPGGDPHNIHIHVSHAEDMSLDAKNNLILKSRLGAIMEQTPASFQGTSEIKTKFRIEGQDISFDIEEYDRSQILVIDPTVSWGTYYGGTNREMFNSCIVDGQGNIYASGDAYSTNNVASGGHQVVFGGGFTDAFLVKFNSAGARLWATYYGGSDWDIGLSSATNGSAVYLSGYTRSTNNIASGGFQNTYGGGTGYYDAFLVKFDNNGVRQWATYYGGNEADYGTGCAVDATGAVYMSGKTTSLNNIASGGFQNTLGGGVWDAFLVKFSSSGAREWATYYGGSGYEYGNSCAVDNTGAVYLAGETASSSNVAYNGFQNTYAGGGIDAFLVKFNPSGARLWATYSGGNGFDIANFCTVDAAGSILLTGTTTSTNGIYYLGHQSTLGGFHDGFLTKFDSNGVRQWGTYYGDVDYDNIYGCSADNAGNIYVAGTTNSSNNIASGGYLNTNPGGANGFLVKMNSAGTRLWATFSGGPNFEHLSACAADGVGTVYIAGLTGSLTNIALNGFQNTYGGGTDGDAYLVKVIDSCIQATITQQPNAQIKCVGDTAVFVVGSPNGVQCQWQVNTGSGFTNITNGGMYNGAANDTLYIYNVPLNANNYTYRCLVSTSPGCAAVISSSATLTVNPTTIPTFSTLPASICFGTIPPVLPLISTNGVNGTWTPSTINNTASGSYLFTPNALPGQCLGNYILNIAVTPAIVPVFNIDTQICQGEIAPILLTTAINGINGTWNPAVVNNTVSATYAFIPLAGQCATTKSINITVGNSSSAIDNKVICAGQLPYTWNGIANSVSGSVFTTTNAQGCDSTVTLQLTVLPPAVTLSADTSACGQLVYQGVQYTNNATVYDTIKSAYGCDSLVKVLHIVIYPNAPLTKIIDTFGCDKVLFEGNAYFNNVTLRDTFLNIHGCDSLIRHVNVIVAHFELNLAVTPEEPYMGESITLEATSNEDHFSITSWMPLAWFPDQHKLNYSIIAREDGHILIRGNNDHGCTDTASVHFKVKPLDYGVFMPNAFSPNGDGINDQFMPRFHMKRAYTVKTFKIFNRWGQIVYSASGKTDVAWDGTLSNGQMADLGTYSYYIVVAFLDRKSVILKGEITLVR